MPLSQADHRAIDRVVALLRPARRLLFIPDFHGPKNNQRGRGRIARFPEDPAPLGP
jgi:hypothetical protein